MTSNQDALFEKGHWWDAHWHNMPEFVQDDQKPYWSLTVNLRSDADAKRFEELAGRLYHGKWCWYPHKGYGNFRNQRWVSAPTLPKYPVYVISKGRAKTGTTTRKLTDLGIPHHVVVEPQEAEEYRASVKAPVLELPFSNLGLGSIPARNFVWEHAKATGAERHWILDDNIEGFYRLNRNAKMQGNTGTFFRAAEEMVDRYENVAIAGFQYEFFAPRREKHDPFLLNTRVYSCILIKNDLPYRWRGRYNEDTDLSLCALKDGWATILFVAFLAKKMPTMRLKGGNTDELYAGTGSVAETWKVHLKQCQTCRKAASGWTFCPDGEEILSKDGRWAMAKALKDAHPDVTEITEKWDRWQHNVDYSRFKRNALKLKPGLTVPEGVNEFGMELQPWGDAPEPEAEVEADDDEDEPKREDVDLGPYKPMGPSPRTQIELLSTFNLLPKPEGWEPDALEPIPADVREVFLDAEATGLRWWEKDRPCGWSVSYRRGDDRVVSRYYPFAHLDGNLPEERVREWFRSELKGRTINNLNTRYDAHMAREWGEDLVELGCTLRDVGHTQALLDDHRREFNLESIARDLLGKGKVKGLDLSRGAAVYPAWQVDEYARQDTVLGVEIADLQEPRIRAEDLERVRDLESAVMPAVLEMERNAAPIDVEKLRRWVRDSEAELNGLRAELSRVVGWNFNPDSRLDMERLFRERGLESPVRTEPSVKYPEGQQSFTDAVLEALESREPAIKLMRRVSHLADLRSKFLVPYLETTQGDGFLRYAFHQLRCDRDEGGQQGTVSGRFSCTQPVKGVGANVQQVAAVSKQLKRDCVACHEGDVKGVKPSLRRHREDSHPEVYLIRELFLPGSGLLAAPDAKQIEYRVFAHFSGSERLAKMYQDDPETDFHAMVGEMVAKMRPDFDRKNVKVLNFGKLFGAGSKKIAEMLRAPEPEVKAFLRTYNQAFPETGQTLKRAMEAGESRGYVRTITGRRVRFPEGCKCGACKTFGPRYHKALNGVVQGTAADIMKMKLVELYARRKELGLTLRMTVHDEVVCDVPDAEAARALGQQLDTQSVKLRVPILWDTKWGRNWAEC